MTKSALPDSLELTEKEFNRLMRFAGDNDLTLRGNSTTFVLIDSIDNWWAFLLLAKWRGDKLNRFEPKGLTLQDLIDAPVNAVVESLDERRVRKEANGWVMLGSDGLPNSNLLVSPQIVMNICPIRFEG